MIEKGWNTKSLGFFMLPNTPREFSTSWGHLKSSLRGSLEKETRIQTDFWGEPHPRTLKTPTKPIKAISERTIKQQNQACHSLKWKSWEPSPAYSSIFPSTLAAKAFGSTAVRGIPHTDGEHPAWAANLWTLFSSQQDEQGEGELHQITDITDWLHSVSDHVLLCKEGNCLWPSGISSCVYFFPQLAALSPEAGSDDICIGNKLHFTLKFTVQTN